MKPTVEPLELRLNPTPIALFNQPYGPAAAQTLDVFWE
jgi:hypothetical protein